MPQIDAMREKLESFYREQFRQKFRVRDSKRHRMVQELVDGEWMTAAKVDMDVVEDADLSLDLAARIKDRLIEHNVFTEMVKLESKHGEDVAGGGAAANGHTKGPSEDAKDAGKDEPAGGGLFALSRFAEGG